MFLMSEVPLYFKSVQESSLRPETQVRAIPQPTQRATGAFRNVQRFRVGLVFKAHRLWVSLNSRLESNKEEEKVQQSSLRPETQAMEPPMMRMEGGFLRFSFPHRGLVRAL